jgi:hypothetical protein
VGQAFCVCPDDKFPGLKHVWQAFSSARRDPERGRRRR